MSRLDHELMHELGGQELEPTASAQGASVPPSPSAAGQPLRQGKRRRNVKVLVALVGLGTLGAGVLLMSFDSAAVYSKGVDELLAERARLNGRTVRVEGTLVRGTLERREQGCEHRFQISKGGATLGVDYPECVLPDTFRDLSYADVIVTAEGKLTDSGRFRATRVMTRCPSKYEVRSRQPGEPPRVISSAAPAGIR